MQLNPLVVFYALPLVLIWLIYLRLRNRMELRSLAKREAASEAGMLEPASLHPTIDPLKCNGCGACVSACPEGEILGLINGKAVLVEPSECIGHGACRAACPNDAITLVFGTERRGVDIPHVGPDFQTNIPGVFIAGELGGMGLIRNAIEQGRQAINSVRNLSGLGKQNILDVVIVGGGPAGFSASLAAMQHKLQFVTIEQDNFGGTVAHFPRGKLVMTAPATLPLVGKVKFREISKEHLLEFWHDVLRRTGLQIKYGERVDGIAKVAGDFEVRTTRDTYRSRSVVLAIGRRGTPRKLEVPGEDQSKVVYNLTDPEQYRGRHVLVVGGGDSALEATMEVAAVAGTTVTLSHRSEGFSRAKMKNRERLTAAQESGSLTVLMKSDVTRIGINDVELTYENRRIVLQNDAVIICAGGVLPTPFLKAIGIQIETKYGVA